MKDNQASSTAYTVLQGQLFSAQNPAYKELVSEEIITSCRQILEASEEGKKRLEQLDSKVMVWLSRLSERILMPGITLHYVLRKRFIEDAVLKAKKNGVTQIVNLGAGFDTLAWRFHKKFPEVTFIEIDHPATNKEKAKAFKDDSDTNLFLLPVDLSRAELNSTLEGFTAFDPEKETLFICEGVLMYLIESDVIKLFNTIKNATSKKVHFVFTSVEPVSSSKNNVGFLLKLYLKYKAEPLNWLITQEDLEQFINKLEFKIFDFANTKELKKRYLKNIEHGTLHEGEYLISATAN